MKKWIGTILILSFLYVGNVAAQTGCDSLGPANLSVSIDPANGKATLSWDSIPDAVKCMTQIRELGDPSFFKIFRDVPPFFIQIGKNNFTDSASYEWRVRCACSLSPLIKTSFSLLDTFTYIAPALRLADMSSMELGLYPNPANDQINLQLLAANQSNVDVTIYDMLGKVVLSAQSFVDLGVNNLTFDVSGLNEGVYFIETLNGTERNVRKMTVTR